MEQEATIGAYPFFRSLLFRLEPEQAHRFSLQLMRLVGFLPPVRMALQQLWAAPQKPVYAFGLTFRNPLGLAAGYDKDGLAWRGLTCLGFGHIEIGTVTLHPQPGNPQPRLFRLPQEQALINRMGFPGKGAAYVARQLQKPRPCNVVLGVNLGKSRATPIEAAAEEYAELFHIFAPLADYLAVNVSSPNTAGLRSLQARQALAELLGVLSCRRRELGKAIPILVKLSPDLTDEELEDALDAILEAGMDGVIVANTTVGRMGIQSPLAAENGGLSGTPLRARSTNMVRQVHHLTGGKLPIVGVGGIMDAADAREKLEAGARLVQIYTGLVYQGPGVVKSILMGL